MNCVEYISHGVGMLEAPEEFYVTAGCGCEVHEGEELYEWENKTLCPDCMEEKFNEMTLQEKAALLGCEFSTVERGKHNRF